MPLQIPQAVRVLFGIEPGGHSSQRLRFGLAIALPVHCSHLVLFMLAIVPGGQAIHALFAVFTIVFPTHPPQLPSGSLKLPGGHGGQVVSDTAAQLPPAGEV